LYETRASFARNLRMQKGRPNRTPSGQSYRGQWGHYRTNLVCWVRATRPFGPVSFPSFHYEGRFLLGWKMSRVAVRGRTRLTSAHSQECLCHEGKVRGEWISVGR